MRQKVPKAVTPMGLNSNFILLILSMITQLETPVSNTGSECQKVSLEASIDYFQGTSVFPNLERFHEAIDYMADAFRQLVVWQPNKPLFAGITWEHSAVTLDGAKIGYKLTEEGNVRCWLSLPGSLFHLVSLRDGWRCLVGLRCAFRFKCNRIDLKLRDYARRKTPTDIYNIAVAGDVARVKSYAVAGEGKIGDIPCLTTYLGSRQSERFLRIYDAEPVHCKDAIDWEVQCRDEIAQQVYADLCDICHTPFQDSEGEYIDRGSIVGGFIAAAVVGVVEFVNRIPGVRLSRLPRQDWWENMVSEAGGQIRHSRPGKSSTVSKSLDWIEKQVSVVMSALRKGLGKSAFDKWLQCRMDDAERRYNNYHEMLIQACKYYKGEVDIHGDEKEK